MSIARPFFFHLMESHFNSIQLTRQTSNRFNIHGDSRSIIESYTHLCTINRTCRVGGCSHSCTMPLWMSSHELIVEHILFSPPRKLSTQTIFYFPQKPQHFIGANERHSKSIWPYFVLSQYFRIAQQNRSKSKQIEANPIDAITLIQSCHFYLIEIQTWIGNYLLCAHRISAVELVRFFFRAQKKRLRMYGVSLFNDDILFYDYIAWIYCYEKSIWIC